MYSPTVPPNRFGGSQRLTKILPIMMALIAFLFFAHESALARSEQQLVPEWSGTVVDESGIPLAATITINSAMTTANADGTFLLGAPVDESGRSVINISLFGYVPRSYVHIGAPITDMRVVLQTPQRFEIDPTQPIDVEDNRGTRITADAGVLVDATGTPIDAPIAAPLYLFMYTPDLSQEAMPGAMTGINQRGETVALESAGVVYAAFVDDAGNEYNLAPDTTAEISVPFELTESFGDAIPLWSYDEGLGMWIQEGIARYAADGRYVGRVSHFSWWNFDIEKQEPACIRLDVDASLLPMLVKAIVTPPGSVRTMWVSSSPTNLFNLPANATVDLFSPPSSPMPFASVNSGAPWGGTGLPDSPDLCNGSVVVESEPEPGEFSGIKFHDLNQNGVQDAGEPPLENWTIELYDSTHTLVDVTTTAANGVYGFGGLAPGIYRVHEVQQAGWVQTAPATGFHTINVTPGLSSVAGQDFGNIEKCEQPTYSSFTTDPAIGATPSTELTGWIDTLWPTHSPFFTTLGQTFTNRFFVHTFDNIDATENCPDGDCLIVDATLTIELEAGPSSLSSNDTIAFMQDGIVIWNKRIEHPGLNGSWGPGQTATVSLDLAALPVAGSYSTNILAALQDGSLDMYVQDDTGVKSMTLRVATCCESIVSGLKFNDINGNGTQDLGEPGLPDWMILITDSAGMTQTVTTDATGTYTATLQCPANYTVSEIQQPGWTQTAPPPTDPLGGVYVITPTVGSTIEGISFGNQYSCDYDISISAGISDTFALPTEPASPSTGLQAWVAANYPIAAMRDFDETTSNRWFGHTFTDLEGINGSSIGGAYLMITVTYEDQNDSMGLWFVDSSGTRIAAWTHNLGGLGVPLGGQQTLVLDLSALPVSGGSPVNLLPDLIANGWLDVIVQDDSAVDYVALDISYYCACVPPPSGMVGWWTMDESSPPISADIAGFPNDAAQLGAPILNGPGMVGNALDFNGIDDYVIAPDHPELNMGTGNFAIDAWIKTTDSKGTFVSKRENAFLGIGYRIMVFNGKPLVQLVDDVIGFKNYFDDSASALTINDDEWHFVAANIDRVNGMGEIYVDGVLIHSFTIFNTGSLDNGGALTIGTDLGSGEYFDGMIDEVELFTRTLTVDEIVSIYNAGSAGKCKDDVAPPRAPDLALSKSHLETLHFGQSGTYSITVTNVGDGPTTGPIEVIDELPSGITYVSANSPWSCMLVSVLPQTVSCSAPGPLAPGDSLTLALDVALGPVGAFPNGGKIKNCAEVNTEGDLIQKNDNGCDETTVTDPPRPPDLTIEKNHVGDFIFEQTGRYSITVINIGDGPTTGDITVTDQLPEGTTYVGVNPSPPWSCAAGPATQVPQFVTCTYSGTLAPDEAVGFTLTVEIGSADVIPGDIPELRNCAEVNTEGDSNLENNDNCDDVIAMGNQCVPPPSGMVGWWPLDEVAGPTAYDLTSVNDGTHVNGPQIGAGMVAGALGFDGIDDYVTVADHPNLDVGTSNFAIDAWIKTIDSKGTFVSKRENAFSGDGYRIMIFQGRPLVQLVDDVIGLKNYFDDSASALTINDDEWHFVAANIDRVNGAGEIYVDGVLIHSFTIVNSGSLDNGGALTIGTDLGSGEYFDGMIDEVELFTRVLTAEEIVSIYNAGSAGKCKDTISVKWDTPVCKGGTSAVVPVSVCNNDIVDHTYTMPEIGGIVGSPACNVDFPNPTSYTVLTDLPLDVSAGQCEVMLVKVDAPPTLNVSGAVGCFTANVQNMETNNVFSHDGSLWRQNSWCAASGADLPLGIATVPASETLPLSFSISNTTGSAATLPWTLTIVPSDMQGENEVAGLNGMEPGQPISGTLPLPEGGVGNLDFSVEFDIYEPFRTYSVLLETENGEVVAADSSTTKSVLASMTIQAKPPKTIVTGEGNEYITYLPAIAR